MESLQTQRYFLSFLRMESRVSLLKEAFSKWLIDFAGRYEEISEASPAES